jgi:hypothetical protein
MTSIAQAVPGKTSPNGASRAALAVLGTAGVVALALAGVTFLGLAVAFPIALPIAERYDIYVSPADAAIARQFAEVWWVFVVASVVTFAAALFAAVKLLGRVSPVPAE